ncbi:hypothetical protein [Clostridium haemolyticum]|uniref:Restriction endonuclease n=1 Tax=Clostridium haemolyticum NCTC 9693 TaxID=1443114 RepID=A0ABR4TB36_CLOHA|nr:hypothetical protein [Clostridium haemolyticum]KEI14141.1 putative restriction endonuclease [Clostridium haemolyticum NCTC 9693]
MGDIKEIQTKICKCCGKEKPVCEFNKIGMDKNKSQKYNTKCKVCSWYDYHKKYTLLPKWNIYDLNTLIDNLINKKIMQINDLTTILQKPLDDIIKMIYINKIKMNNIKVEIKCKNCSKIMSVWVCDIINNKQFCSKKCQKSFKQAQIHNQKTNNMKKCNKCHHIKPLNEFGLDKYKSDGYNNKCKVCDRIARLKNNITIYDDWTIQDLRTIFDLSLNNKVNTINEMQKFIPNKSIEEILNFASKNNLKLYNLHVQVKCTYCNKDILVRKDEYLNYNDYFCNRKCKNNYLQKDNIQCTCDWCKKVIIKTKSAFESRMRKHHFCSVNCSQKFFKNITVKTDKWKTMLKKNAINNLQKGAYKTNSSIQIKINNILEELSENYINEYPIGYYALDNYLLKHNLLIEVMGTYWHCDNRYYNNIKYKMQRKRIANDKTKHNYIVNNHGIEILYLWESDINNNLALCKQLIKHYINNKGRIINYHSFNYHLDNNNLILNKNLIRPYMEWDKKELSSITSFAN